MQEFWIILGINFPRMSTLLNVQKHGKMKSVVLNTRGLEEFQEFYQAN